MLYGNDFEQVIFPVFPQLERLCVELLRGGAAVARMSGTGASVFGLFPEGDAAANIAEKLRSAGFAVYAHAL
jgi:4-diphosphocytidyl-2-C-methyl-D-erythritol kinase